MGSEDPTRNTTVIELRNDDCTIYLKHIVWGITADNSITYIGQTMELKDTINEPYFRAIDFFYKLKDECVLHIYNSDSLHRSHLSKVNIRLLENSKVNYSNFKKEGYANILYN